MQTLEQKLKKYLEKIEKENSKLNIFLHLNPSVKEEAKIIDKKSKKGRLYGKIIGIKSNINVKGLITNCASRTLENYVAPYNASVIEKIKAEDGLIIGMLNMDEFACGSSGEKSAFGPCINPIINEIIPGGSSSGSAAAVAAEFCDMTLGSDTGGSIRNPASNCGVVGIKPSYGLVSRYGLIDLSMSLDQIGPIAKNVEEAALLLDVIRGKDEKDTTTFESKEIKFGETKNIRIGILKINGVDKTIQSLIDSIVEKAVEEYSWLAEEVEIQHINLAVQTYYPLVYVEFFSATRRFDGRRYGKKIEENCGVEVLRRILGGQEITKAEYEGAYYKKSLEVREIIKREFQEVFEKFDCVILPTVPKLPWKIGEGKKMKPEEEYAYDALTIPANLAGCCAISIPAGKIKNIPIGLQIMCAQKEESKMVSIAKKLEELILRSKVF